MIKKAYYCKKQELEINRLIGPAVKEAKKKLSEYETKKQLLSRTEKDSMFSLFFHNEMDRKTKERGLRF